MKKLYFILVFIALFLGGFIFFLGVQYEKIKSQNTGSVIYNIQDYEKMNALNEKIDNLSKELVVLKDNNLSLKKSGEVIIGGGYLFGNVNDAKSRNGYECFSWGKAFCQNSTTFNGRVELKCPENYKVMLTGFYTSNALSSSNAEFLFLCLDNNLVIENNSLKIQHNQ